MKNFSCWLYSMLSEERKYVHELKRKQMMLNQVKSLGLAACFAMAANIGHAAAIDEIPPLNPDEGRPGEHCKRVPSLDEFSCLY